MSTAGRPHCIPPKARFNIQHAIRAIHIFTDLVLLSLPIIRLWNMQMPARKKVGICLLFSLGIISMLGSIMRIVLLVRHEMVDLPCRPPTEFLLHPQYLSDANVKSR